MSRNSTLVFAAMCIIWGIPYFLIRVAVGEISPVVLVFGRTAIGALILMPIVIAKGGLRGIGMRWIPLLAFAAAEIGGPWFFLSIVHAARSDRDFTTGPTRGYGAEKGICRL